MSGGRQGGIDRAPGALASAGFTLIEVLVVMVVIGCLAGLAVISSGVAGPARELRNEAERLAGLIGVLADEAVLDNREYGLRIERDGYQVFFYDETTSRWRALSDDARQLPEWAELSIELEGEPLALPAPDKEGKKTKDARPVPQLIILSSGELSPFRLELGERRKDGLRLQLSSDGFRLPRVENLSGKGRAG
ncbi:type II secretion system minor pseudopilin GspH [Pseudomonas sp. TCU-HL1]|uniref:type II secretion system minor pseudopilin GspH n=1 Tax=Pseudomonas sp. TCU-HL1 TaxID=1856685 RepID=UPI00083D69C8|nr:type II secretion system minor pseudopilin GspH [Pseudomonas sp. TCU-HL1]AOE84585.1 general secretion pathway protein GspH [Pseudomonas sp. TCU-HL1]